MYMFSSVILPIVLVALILTQVILALLHARYNQQYAQKHDFPLISRTTTVELLEKFSRIYEPIDIKVNAAISTPALYQGGVLRINKEWVYEHRAFATLNTLVELVKMQHGWEWQQLQMWQKLLLVLQVSLLIAGINQPVVVVVSLLLVLTQLSLSIYFAAKMEDIIKQAIEIGRDLLDLNVVELEQAPRVLRHLLSDPYTYPVQLVQDVIYFLFGFFSKSTP